MKYVVLIVIAALGYYVYQNHYDNNDSKFSIVEEIAKHGSVAAEEVKKVAKKHVASICDNDEILRTWDSSSKECWERTKNFEKGCESRIFPNNEKAITDREAARKLISRYRKCILTY